MEPSSCLGPADVDGNASALHCRDRWLALQRLRVRMGAEAVLLILGPDSNFDRAGELLFNWLLGGLSGRDLLAAPLDPRFEECVVCVRATGTRVFCKRKVREELAAKTSMWESCEVVAPSREQEADLDDYETCKTFAFIDMVSGLKSIGVAIREEGGVELRMLVEKWPLVQAHAFDEFGLGFLTLRAAVMNFEAVLQRELYPQWDLLSVLRARVLVPKLVNAWDEAMLLRDRQPRQGGKERAAAPVAAAAPLVDLFEYGRLSLSDEDIMDMRGDALPPNVPAGSLVLDPAPRVLVGPEQSATIRQGVAADMLDAEGPAPGGDALHMVWEAVEPLTGAAVVRTYALGGHALLAGGGAAAGEPVSEQHQVLLRAYAVAVAIHRQLASGNLEALAFMAPVERDAGLARAAAEAAAALGGVPGRLEVSCAVLDAMGLPVAAGAAGSVVALVFLRVMVADVTFPGVCGSLGTVAFGDSVFCVRPCSGAAFCSCSGGLASDVPVFAFWPLASELACPDAVRAGLDSCLGVGFDPGPSVALGHRSGVRVYLEKKGPPPDPLGLGSCVDREVLSALAWDLSPLAPGQLPMAAATTGVAWTFDSGKVVVSTHRTGHVVLHVVFDGAHLHSSVAPNGQVWVPVETATGASMPFRAAVAVSPSTAALLQTKAAEAERLRAAAGEAPAEPPAEGFDDLGWVSALRRPAGGGAAAAMPPRLLDLAALAGAHAGGMPVEACDAALSELRMTPAPVAPCRCIWVSGLPGCGAIDVATALASALGAHLVDLAAVLGLGVGATDGVADMRFVASVLAGVVQPLAQQGSCIVVCDVLCSPAEVLSDLAVQAAFAAACRVVHVVSVLDPAVAYPARGRRHPLLHSRCLRGWVSAVVLQDARPPTAPRGRSAAAREREVLASLLAKEAAAARGGSESVLPKNTAALASGPLQLPPACRALKALALPDAPGCREFLAPAASLRCVFVAVALPLDTALLREACLSSLDAATASPEIAGAFRGLFCIEARVRGLEGSELEELGSEAMLGALRGEAVQAVQELVLTAAGEAAVPQRWPEPLASHPGVLFWWCLDGAVPGGGEAAEAAAAAARRAAAEAAVEESRLRPPARRCFWQLSDIPEDVVEQARTYMLSVEAPQGFYYNGLSYVDVDGNEQQNHPLLGDRLQQLLGEHNGGVEAWNAAVDEASTLQMFVAPSARG